MSAADVTGCALYYSGLNRVHGIPYTFECAVEEGRVSGVGGLASYAREALDTARPLLGGLGSCVSLGGFESWEFIGRGFNMYQLPLSCRGERVGVLRLVERGGLLLGVFGALGPWEDAPRPAGPGGLLGSVGRYLRLVYLEPVGEVEGQRVVPRNPIYAVEGIQGAGPEWSIRVEGLVEESIEVSISELVEAALERRDDPFHCVTGWSLEGRTWEGVPVETLLSMARPRPEARWLAAVSSGGYAAVMPLEYARRGLLAMRLDGEPLPREMGAPVRLFVPGLYGWKHVKWLRRIILLDSYIDGYWEALAYHERGLAAAAERFKVRNFLVARERRVPPPSRPMRP